MTNSIDLSSRSSEEIEMKTFSPDTVAGTATSVTRSACWAFDELAHTTQPSVRGVTPVDRPSPLELEPKDATIRTFVQNEPLFKYVAEKEEAIARLVVVREKTETQKKLQILAVLFNTGPMTIRHPLFQDSDFEELIVLACISSKITIDQLGTAFYWKSALNHYKNNILEVPLFGQNKKEVNPIAKGYIKQCVQQSFDRSHDILNDLQLTNWFESMREQPASEQLFLLSKGGFAGWGDMMKQDGTNYERSRILYNNLEEKNITIMGLVSSCNKEYNDPDLFNQVEIKGDGVYRMVSSFGMNSALYAEIGGKAKLVSRFGMSKSLRENGLRAERDIALRSKFAKTLETADGAPAPFEEMTSHDLVYHAYITNRTPVWSQTLNIALADKVRDFANNSRKKLEEESVKQDKFLISQYEKHVKTMDQIASICEDMECNYFRRSSSSDQEAAEKHINNLEIFSHSYHNQVFLAELKEIMQDTTDPEDKELRLQIIAPSEDDICKTKNFLRMQLRELLEKKGDRTEMEELILANLQKQR